MKYKINEVYSYPKINWPAAGLPNKEFVEPPLMTTQQHVGRAFLGRLELVDDVQVSLAFRNYIKVQQLELNIYSATLTAAPSACSTLFALMTNEAYIYTNETVPTKTIWALVVYSRASPTSVRKECCP
jgi:hypothetical protein